MTPLSLISTLSFSYLGHFLSGLGFVLVLCSSSVSISCWPHSLTTRGGSRAPFTSSRNKSSCSCSKIKKTTGHHARYRTLQGKEWKRLTFLCQELILRSLVVGGFSLFPSIWFGVVRGTKDTGMLQPSLNLLTFQEFCKVIVTSSANKNQSYFHMLAIYNWKIKFKSITIYNCSPKLNTYV